MNTIKKSFYRFLSGSGFVLILFLLLTVPVYASTPLVEPAWLLENLNKPGIRVLDLQSHAGYLRAHLPGSVNTDYSRWRVTGPRGIPKMLPGQGYLETLIGQLGIDNQTYVILAPVGAGAGDMAVATRIYWTFKAMGHDDIAILNGGLLGYSRMSGSRFVQEATVPQSKQFKSRVRADYFPDVDEVKAALDRGVTFVDSRSDAEYTGQVGGSRAGTIPGSISLNYEQLVVKGQGRFHDVAKIREIYRNKGVPLDGEQISFCHTGHRTSLSWFVSHELLGNKVAKMYDGSMIEWATNPDLPMDVLYQRQ